MTYRIELLFAGDAPDDEMQRAQMLAAPDVRAAIEQLSQAFDAAGLSHTVTARSVRVPSTRRQPALRPVEAAE